MGKKIVISTTARVGNCENIQFKWKPKINRWPSPGGLSVPFTLGFLGAMADDHETLCFKFLNEARLNLAHLQHNGNRGQNISSKECGQLGM